MVCRVSIRLRLRKRLFWDDILAAVGCFFLLAQNIVNYFVMDHFEVINASKPQTPPFILHYGEVLKLSFCVNILFATSIYAIKGSFLALMWSIVENLTFFRRFWWAVVGTVTLFYLLAVSFEPIVCAKFWFGGCNGPADIRRNLITVRTSTAFDVLTDLLIMALPISFILNSRLPLAQKFGLIGLFSLGFCIIACSVIRIVSLDTKKAHPPITWKEFWGIVESSVAVMTSCFASFKSVAVARKRATRYPLSILKKREPAQDPNTTMVNVNTMDLEFSIVDHHAQSSSGNGEYAGAKNISKWDGESTEEILCPTSFRT
ncbi:hypothetical protein FQN57_006742 [Myotisia sp. PD_48]|nr:hypothetical protein FQN57_006742 [Myotisia sp. PD_48]